MGFSFRKSFNLGGARINLSKSGIGASAGVKGFRVTKTANGSLRKTFTLPGTGIRHISESSKAKEKAAPATELHNTAFEKKALKNIFRIIGIVGMIPSLLLSLIMPGAGLIGLLVSIGCLVAAKNFKEEK